MRDLVPEPPAEGRWLHVTRDEAGTVHATIDGEPVAPDDPAVRAVVAATRSGLHDHTNPATPAPATRRWWPFRRRG